MSTDRNPSVREFMLQELPGLAPHKPFEPPRVSDERLADDLERFTPGVMGAIVSAMASRQRRYSDMGAPEDQARSDYDAAVWLADNMPSLRKALRTSGGVKGTHPLSDENIDQFWPGSDPAETRRQFDALMAHIGNTAPIVFPRFPELMAGIVVDKARELPERIALLEAALAGLPEHWRQWQWRADEKPVFGETYVRSVYGDNGHGFGRQAIAVVPADKHYFGTVADFIAAANPDTLMMLLAERQQYASPPIEPAGVTVTDAARDVLAERQRQIDAEGWTPEHDDLHCRGEMATAAACYAAPNAVYWGPVQSRTALEWPWDVQWWKPSDGKRDRPLHRRRDLVKAAALIIAEIERLDRAALALGDASCPQS